MVFEKVDYFVAMGGGPIRHRPPQQQNENLPITVTNNNTAYKMWILNYTTLHYTILYYTTLYHTARHGALYSTVQYSV